MAKKQIETVPVSNVPNVSANDPANASLNDYSKMKINSDIKKKEKVVKRLSLLVNTHDAILEQQKKDLETYTLDLEKLKTLQNMLY
jgi:hypothetical protein